MGNNNQTRVIKTIKGLKYEVIELNSLNEIDIKTIANLDVLNSTKNYLLTFDSRISCS